MDDTRSVVMVLALGVLLVMNGFFGSGGFARRSRKRATMSGDTGTVRHTVV